MRTTFFTEFSAKDEICQVLWWRREGGGSEPRFQVGSVDIHFAFRELVSPGEEEEVGVVGVEHGARAAVPVCGGGDGIDWISGPGEKSPTKQKNSCAPREIWYFGESVWATCLEETEGSGSHQSGSC